MPPETGTNVAPLAPTKSHFGKLRECKTILEALSHPDAVDRFRQSVPRHLSAERMLRVCALAVSKTPKLAQCDVMTLLGAMLACASLGLEPNTPLGLAHLIPFEKRRKIPGTNQWETESIQVNLIIGYRGYIDLARRGGSLTSIHADVVYEGDDFSFEYGSKQHLRHVPKGDRNRKMLWAYAHAKLSDGEAFGVWPMAQVLAIRDASEGYKSAKRAGTDTNTFKRNPWEAFFHEMAAKTMVRQLAKFLPMSIEFANAAALDAMSEGGSVDFASMAESGVIEGHLQGMIEESREQPIETVNTGTAAKEPAAATAGEQQQAKQQPAQAADAPKAQPQGGLTMPIAIWGPDGDQVGETTSPIDFAKKIEQMAAAETDDERRGMLLDNNRSEASEIAQKFPGTEAASIIAALYQQPAAEEQSQQEEKLPDPVELPLVSGKPQFPKYVEAVKAALEQQSAATISAFERANQETVAKLPSGTKLTVLKLIAATKARLGVKTE